MQKSFFIQQLNKILTQLLPAVYWCVYDIEAGCKQGSHMVLQLHYDDDDELNALCVDVKQHLSPREAELHHQERGHEA